MFSSWAEALGLVVGTSGAIVKKFRDYRQAMDFVKVCREDIIHVNQDEGPPDGSSDWRVKSAPGRTRPPDHSEVGQFFKGNPRTPKEPIVIQDEGPPPELKWYAVANGRHGVSNIFKSWEEASEFFLGSPGALVEKFKTRDEALAFLENHQRLPEDKGAVTSPTSPQLEVD